MTKPDTSPDWENFAKAVLDDWPTGDMDGNVLFDLALQYGMIKEVPGGFDPDRHIDADGICPEEGDPWYEYTFRGQAGPGLYSIIEMEKRIEALQARLALYEGSTGPVSVTGIVDDLAGIVEALRAENARLREFVQTVADGHAKDYSDNMERARAILQGENP